MSELKSATDITISDRLTTQLHNEVKIRELSEKLQKTEAELLKFKSAIEIVSNPNNSTHEVKVELNGMVSSVVITDKELDYYLESTEPVQALVNDLIDILTKPYRKVVSNEITDSIAAIVKNRMIAQKGRSL